MPRPETLDAIVEVMGLDACSSDMVTERLASRGWTPDSQNPGGLVGFVMAQNCSTDGSGYFVPVTVGLTRRLYLVDA